ncbi:MAG: carbohydrate ABC transporter permease [Eubacterium sp.]|nr:carbohydrate ABC transporter permease [Eubacterium sp.]
MDRTKKSAALLCRALLLFPVILTVLPLFLIFVNSFMEHNEAALTYGGILDGSGFSSFVLMPASPSLSPYADLFLYCRDFYTAFWNSVTYTALIVTGQIVAAVPAAWAFAKLCLPLKKTIFTIYMVFMMLPFQVTMLSNYFMLDRTGLFNTRWAFILPCIFSTFPVFVMTRFFGDLPDELIEAARIDGAGSFQIFWQIGIPIGKSGITAVTVLQVLEIWNTVEQPLFFIREPALFPLALFFPTLTADTFGSSFAAAIVMMLPPLLIFLYGRQELEAGISHIGIEK